MSGFSYPQPTFVSSVYNPSFYLSLDASGYLTYAYAQTLYLSRDNYRLSYLSGIIAGTAGTGVALVPDSNLNLSGLNLLTTNILNISQHDGATKGLSLGGVLITASGIEPNYVDCVAGTAAANKALVLNSTKDITGINSLTTTTLDCTTLKQGGVFYTLSSFLTTLPSSITISGTLSAGTINATTIQQGGTSYTLANILTTSTTSITLSGTLSAATVNATTLQKGGTTISSTATQLNYCNITTLGTAQASKVLTCDASVNITGVNNVNITGTTVSSGSTTGALVVAGGIGVGGIINCADSVNIGGVSTFSRQIYHSSNYALYGNQAAIVGSTLCSGYGLVIGQSSDAIGNASGLCFYNDSSYNTTLSTATPSASIVATRTGGSYALSNLSFYTRSADAVQSSLTERVRINQDGRVSFMGVEGAQNVNLLSGSSSVAFRIGTSESTKNCMTLQWNYSSSGSDSNYISFDPYGASNAFVVKANGWVGVGTSSPASQFDVQTSIWCSEWFHTKNNGLGACCTFRGSSYSTYTGFGSYSTTTPAIRFGSYTSAFAWSAYCPVYGGAYTNASDERLKKDIEDIPYGLDAVMAMKPRRFTWRQDNKVAIGFIAQELEVVLPEPVSTPEGDLDEMNADGLPINAMGVDYACLTSVLCKAIQELNAKVESLQALMNP